MRRVNITDLTLLCLTFSLLSCGEDSAAPLDAAPPDAALIEATCDEVSRRAEGLSGPFTCATAPEFVTVGGVDIFKYEASHPLARANAAFPCARSNGPTFQAPEGPAEACAVAGVRPWHSVTYGDAAAACAAIGWRLCSGAEFSRACAGAAGARFTYGQGFDAAACNIRNGYADPGDEGLTSEAPAGAYAGCVSDEGVYDLGGNLWEWVQAEGGQLYRRGAGWRLIAELHHDDDHACAAQIQAPEILATYAASDVGFRCCR
ncbi:formylglycine-generating enzyme family protein [Myxococcota bacterium]|nr:formylglycine-generating enzyme family protein [Myxococcota bacterium]